MNVSKIAAGPFNTAPECISNYKQLPWTQKAISLIKSFGTLFLYFINRVSLFLQRADAKMDPYTRLSEGEQHKERLVVCIHGLNNNPTQFKKLVAEMEKAPFDSSTCALFIPRVHKKGNDYLDRLVSPIFETIGTWANTASPSGEKELVLIGVSNGARIAQGIEVELAKSKHCIKKFHFISIVGACRGSKLVNQVKECGLSCLMSKEIAEEMPVGSVRNQRLDAEWRQGWQNNPQRRYTFYASPHDWQVTNDSSSLMDVGGQAATYTIVPGHGHNSIVNALAQRVASQFSGTGTHTGT